ncbi:MAG TPA: metal-dependent hydrolase [Chitinophagaceae bacterium]|jgi:L-ascorbate metabolism protein UlaG (beta-lactamase superfamily)|nr:metal-dependent hydrolase [Chitinophagaceae bacterium]
MKFTYYGHSCFSVVLAGKKVLFDPFITPNELAGSIDVSSIEADFILVSHGHVDHIADCVSIAQRTKATVVCSWEISEWLCRKGVEKTHPMNTGGKWAFDFGTVKCVVAQHSSGLPDGSYGGNPMGFIINSYDKSFYYSGDTALTLDMQLVPRWGKVDFAIFPIGDNFTMDYSDAIEAARMVNTSSVVAVHYDTFPYIKINHQQVKQAFLSAGINLHMLAVGQTIEL